MTTILRRLLKWSTSGGNPSDWRDDKASDEAEYWIWFDGRLEKRLASSPPIAGAAEVTRGTNAQIDADIDRVCEATRRIIEVSGK